MRADGVRVKNGNPMYTVAAHFMSHRYDSMNMVEVDVPMQPMTKYIIEKRKEGKRISHLALVVTAWLRTAAEFPELNRFVANKNIYARNEYAVSMVVLKPGSTEGTMNKVKLEPEDDIFTVQEKLDAYVEQNRQAGETNSTDKVISLLLSVPGLVRVGVNVLKVLDKWGWLPKSVIDMSPFHSSLVISNLASIRSKHIYHHIYEFGTTSLLITMGSPIEVPKKKGDEIVFEHCIPMGIVMDERIASGSYFTKCMHKMEYYLRDPINMEGTPQIVIKEFEKNKK